MRYETYISDFKIDTFYNFGVEQGRLFHDESLWNGVDQKNGLVRGGDPEVLDPLLIKNVKIHTNSDIDQGYGVRIGHSGNGDISFTYLRTVADTPVLEFSKELQAEIQNNAVTPTGLNAGVSFKFINEDVFGLDYVTSINEQIFKIEASYIPNAPVLNQFLELEEMEKARLSIGGDIESDSFISAIVWQLIHETILTEDELFLDKDLTQGIVQFSKKLFADEGEIGLRTIINFNDQSFYYSPFFLYEVNDAQTLGASFHGFSGDDESFYGYHKDNDLFTLNYSYLF